MDLRHLRYFVAVAESLNLSKAAAKLHVAQPALSRQIRDVEEELGITLLERGSRGVRLTTAGQTFADEARAILERVRQAIEATRHAALTCQGELHVGYAPSPTVELLPRALHAFQNEASEVRVTLHDLSNEQMLGGLRERTLDVALMVRPSARGLRGLMFEELIRYPIRVALSPRHPLAGVSGGVTLRQLAGERLHVYAQADYPEYHDWLQGLYTALKQPPKIADEHDSANSLIAAVEAGQGVALAPSCLACLAGARLRFVELRPAPEPIVVGVACAAGKLSPAAMRFLSLLRKLGHADFSSDFHGRSGQ